MNKRVIVYVVNLGIETTGNAHVSLLTERNYCCRQENRVFTNCNVIMNYRRSKRAFSEVLFRTTLTVSFY